VLCLVHLLCLQENVRKRSGRQSFAIYLPLIFGSLHKKVEKHWYRSTELCGWMYQDKCGCLQHCCFRTPSQSQQATSRIATRDVNFLRSDSRCWRYM